MVLGRSLDKHLVPCIQFPRDIIGSDDDLCTSLDLRSLTLMVDLDRYIRPAVEDLRRAGLAKAAISKLLVIHISMLALSPDQISKALEDLKEIDMYIEDSRFIYCFGLMCVIKRETRLRKLALYKSFGLSKHKVFTAFKRRASILHIAEEIIKKKVRFFLDELKLRIHDIMVRPVILGYSLEKCILPRCDVLSVLMKEGRIQKDIKLLQALLGSSRTFSTRFVLRHADHVPAVLKAYEGKIEFEGFGYDR